MPSLVGSEMCIRDSVIPVQIPPLRERREDIPLLVEHFVKKHRKLAGKRIERIEDGLLKTLEEYDWPGNVRELENTIERAVAVSTGPVITPVAISAIGSPKTQTSALPSLEL